MESIRTWSNQYAPDDLAEIVDQYASLRQLAQEAAFKAEIVRGTIFQTLGIATNTPVESISPPAPVVRATVFHTATVSFRRGWRRDATDPGSNPGKFAKATALARGYTALTPSVGAVSKADAASILVWVPTLTVR